MRFQADFLAMLHFTDPRGTTEIGREIARGPVRKRASSSYIWALVSGFPEPIRRNRPLLMLQAYIDDSRSDNPSAFVLGGFIAKAEKWASFSDEWQQFLDMPPAIKYFKMSEAMSFSGEFSHWSEERRDERLRLMHRVIEDHVSAGINCIIRPNEYANVFKNSVVPKKLHNPFFIFWPHKRACYLPTSAWTARKD